MKAVYEIMSRRLGPFRAHWDRALRSAFVGAIVQGLAYLSLFLIVPAVVNEDNSRTYWLLSGLVVLLVFESIARIRELSFNYVHFGDVLAHLRTMLGQRLRTMPSEELSKRQSGDLSTVLSGNVTDATMAAGDIGMLYVRLVVVPLVLLVGLAVVDWRLLFAVLGGLLIGVPGFFVVRRRAKAAFPDVHDADADSSSRVVEYVQGLPVFKATGQVGERSERLVDALEHQGHVLNASQSSMTIPLMLGGMGAQILIVAIIAIAAALFNADSLTAAVVAAVAIIAVRFAEPLILAGALGAIFELSRSGLSRIDELMSVQPLSVPEKPATMEGHDISFEDVSFTYQTQERPALDGVTFTMPERSMTALVGTSGSGKTTIARMLMRYADPQRGVVRIGGADVSTVKPDELMRHLSVVFQDVYLFDNTIAENVRMARPDATDEEVAHALTVANSQPLLDRLPSGMHTRVGEVGSMLSGGERQRVAIARALLKDAPILILDEPTSALDSDSEVAIQDAIDVLVRNRTVLVIAHRLSTVVGADQILVLDDGHVIEQGDHEKLITSGGRYAALWEAQQTAKRWKIHA